MSGVFWWNLDDNSILTSSHDARDAAAENLPHGGLTRNGEPKEVYKVLDRLINKEWTTNGNTESNNGAVQFRGFFGRYEIEVEGKKYDVHLSKDNKDIKIEL